MRDQLQHDGVARLVHPIAISFDAAIPIAVVGLMVDIASVWLLSGGSIVITGTGAVT